MPSRGVSVSPPGPVRTGAEAPEPPADPARRSCATCEPVPTPREVTPVPEHAERSLDDLALSILKEAHRRDLQRGVLAQLADLGHLSILKEAHQRDLLRAHLTGAGAAAAQAERPAAGE